MVTVPAAVLERYGRFSLYNSPYDAHDDGRAIDLYPDGAGTISPVSGTILDTRSIRAPPKPYAPEHDYLIVIETDDYEIDDEPAVARILHVEPTVSAGDEVSIGDDLGDLVRAGFFAPWVDNHLHLEFRANAANRYRASGSVPLQVGTPIEPLVWDGTGTIVEVGDTYALLDRPTHPAPGEYFAGIAADCGTTALDGGLPHYDRGGAFAGSSGPVELLGTTVATGQATPSSETASRTLAWNDVRVLVDGEPITGLSLFASRVEFGAKLVHPEHSFTVGDRVAVTIERS